MSCLNITSFGIVFVGILVLEWKMNKRIEWKANKRIPILEWKANKRMIFDHGIMFLLMEVYL